MLEVVLIYAIVTFLSGLGLAYLFSTNLFKKIEKKLEELGEKYF